MRTSPTSRPTRSSGTCRSSRPDGRARRSHTTLESGSNAIPGCTPGSLQCIVLQKDLLGQATQFYWTVKWAPETADYPETPTRFDFDLNGTFQDLQPCLAVPTATAFLNCRHGRPARQSELCRSVVRHRYVDGLRPGHRARDRHRDVLWRPSRRRTSEAATRAGSGNRLRRHRPGDRDDPQAIGDRLGFRHIGG